MVPLELTRDVIYQLDYQCFRKGYINLFTARHILSLVKH